MATGKPIEALTKIINSEAARLTGVSEILEHVGESSQVAFDRISDPSETRDDENERNTAPKASRQPAPALRLVIDNDT